MSVTWIRREDVPLSSLASFDECELLPGSYPLVRAFRGRLTAGSNHTFAAADARCFHVYCFTEGLGCALTSKRVFPLEGLCFLVPDPTQGFSLAAVQTLEYTRFEVYMLDSDLREWNETHCILPWFKTLETSEPYWQSCKSENTQSWYVICRKLLPRTIMGVVRAQGPGREGTSETGHPNVAQWNVMLPGSDIELTVEEETVPLRYGDFSYVPAGAPHSLISLPGKLNYYIWFEHFVRELDGPSWQP